MKALIINYNRLTLMVKMAHWLSERGLNVIIIDNNSDYGPLLDYYNSMPFGLLRLDYNHGHTCVWNPDLRIFEKLGITGRYIVTDPDLDLSGVPDNFLDVLSQGLDKYPAYDKCGLSLEINDLPDSKEGNFIRYKCEARYWMRALDPMYFHADTDTTLAMYRETAREYNHNAIRTNRPYTAKHVPWYYTDFNLLPEEEKNYFITASDSSSGKKRLLQ